VQKEQGAQPKNKTFIFIENGSFEGTE